MNRLQYLLMAKNQYNIQSPFLYSLYSNVLAPRLGRKTLKQLGIRRCDSYAQLRFKLCDHFHTSDAVHVGWDDCLLLPDGSCIGMVRMPHRNKSAEGRWLNLVNERQVTLSVDLFDAGLLFTDPRLSKQHFVFRVF